MILRVKIIEKNTVCSQFHWMHQPLKLCNTKAGKVKHARHSSCHF
jgi:hypothetical protein